MFFVGSFIRMDTKASQRILLTLCVVMAGLLVAAVVIHQSLLGPFLVFSPSNDPEVESSTYQGAGRSILITGIVASALIPGTWRQLGILGVAVVALLSLGSRTYLLAGASCLVLAVLLAAIKNRHYVSAFVFVVLVGGAAYAAREFFFATRARELLDLAQSSSWQMRMSLQENALDAIRSNPLIGDFAYHIREIAPGGYAHNVLSAWTEFGLIGFCLYVALIFGFLVIAFRRIFSPNPLWHAAVALNAATVIIIMAEPVFSVVPALGWGMVVNALLSERSALEAVPLTGRA
jgi:hypothetical protein